MIGPSLRGPRLVHLVRRKVPALARGGIPGPDGVTVWHAFTAAQIDRALEIDGPPVEEDIRTGPGTASKSWPRIPAGLMAAKRTARDVRGLTPAHAGTALCTKFSSASRCLVLESRQCGLVF